MDEFIICSSAMALAYSAGLPSGVQPYPHGGYHYIRTRKQHVWKSSPLVLLFSTPEVDTMAPWEKGGLTLNEIDAVSKKMDLRLEPEQDGVKFRAARI